MDNLFQDSGELVDNFMNKIIDISSASPLLAAHMVATVYTSYLASLHPTTRSQYFLELCRIRNIIGDEVFEDTDDLIAKIKEDEGIEDDK